MDLWYASYGSNLSEQRFAAYIAGGQPQGARRATPGCRDSTAPAATAPLRLPGRLVFGWQSPTWGGGVAFYHPQAQGVTLAVAYLITAQQFSDVAAQEMHRPVGADLDLADVLRTSRHAYGPGRYETLHRVGSLQGRPVLTLTAPEPHRIEVNAPSRAYLRMISRGLMDSHGLGPGAVADYLMEAVGMAPGWSRDEVAEVAASS